MAPEEVCKPFYLQATLMPHQLDTISLISEIPGSERWRIQDLFQRDVDNERVTEDLLPFLKEQDHIKFFNPLTLTVLPMDEDGYTVLKQMPEIVESDYEENLQSWKSLERTRFFKICWVHDDDDERYGKLDWNTKLAKLVAIDGQHRLSALKRYFRNEAADGHREFLKWRIPIVVVSFRAVESNEPPSVLDVVRNIFVYINSEAQKVNDSRKILLSDEKINYICTQELIQEAHENESAENPDPSKVPLLFYDWRGEEIKKEAIPSVVAIKEVTEIHNWFENYILGDEDRSTKQKTALNVLPNNELNAAFVDKEKRLTYDQVKLLRTQFQNTLLEPISYLLQNFTPYKNYIEKLRNLERAQSKFEDIGSHALSHLKFGTNVAIGDIQDKVRDHIERIRVQVTEIKSKEIGSLLGDDIGMRGIISAYGNIFEQMETPKRWLDYTEWYVDALNEAYADDWFNIDDRHTLKHLRHIVKDHNENTVNYRLEQAQNSFGAFVELLIFTYADEDVSTNVDWDQVWDSAISRVRTTVLRGYKKEVRVKLKEKEEYKDGGKKLTEAVAKEANKLTNKMIKDLEKVLLGE